MSVASPSYDNLRVQYYDGSDWQDFGPVQDLQPGTLSRRFASDKSEAAQKWRLVAQRPSSDGGTVAIKRIKACQETSVLSDCRQAPFAFSSSQIYSMWMSDKTIDVFSGGVFLASVEIPHVSEDLSSVTYDQSLDTLLLFHRDYPTWRIFRQGRHTAWDSRPAQFENVPLFDYNGDGLNGLNAVQNIRFRDYTAGDTYRLTLAGETTRTIVYSASPASGIQTALGNLKNVDASGLSVGFSGDIATVTFTGKNGSKEWPEMFGETIQSETGGIVVSTTEPGKPGGEPEFSNDRGYAAAGVFFQQRTWLGGFKSRPATLGASVAGDYYNLDIDLTTDDVGLDVTLDGGTLLEVRHIIAGRNLSIFTASAEYYVPAGVITRDTLEVRQASEVGVREGIRPVVVDGPVLFVERRSGALRAFVYSDRVDSYVPEVISLHASHLLPDPIGLTRRRARGAKEADLLFIPNSGGRPAAVLTFSQSQSIVAFTRFTTQGKFLAAGVEDLTFLEVAVERDGEVYLELFREDCLLDSSVLFDDVAGQTTFDVPHLEGKEVCVMIDGVFDRRVAVENNQIVIAGGVSANRVEIGLEAVIAFRTLPVRRLDQSGGFSKNKYRIVRADFNFEVSGPYALIVNDGNEYCYDPRTAADKLDSPPPLFQGPEENKGFLGSSYRPDLYFRQTVPARFHLRSLDMETSQ